MVITTEGGIDELEDRSIEIIHTEEQKEKSCLKKSQCPVR